MINAQNADEKARKKMERLPSLIPSLFIDSRIETLVDELGEKNISTLT